VRNQCITTHARNLQQSRSPARRAQLHLTRGRQISCENQAALAPSIQRIGGAPHAAAAAQEQATGPVGVSPELYRSVACVFHCVNPSQGLQHVAIYNYMHVLWMSRHIGLHGGYSKRPCILYNFEPYTSSPKSIDVNSTPPRLHQRSTLHQAGNQ
jgi:hypothetical protein